MRSKDRADALPVLKGRRVAIDTETTGLDPWHGDRIFCWSYCTDRGEKGFMRKTVRNLGWVDKILNNPSKQVIFQNAKFDLEMFYFEGIDIFNLKAEIHDTLLLSKVLDSVEDSHSLRSLASRHLGRNLSDKDAIDLWLDENSRRFQKEHGRKPNFSDAPLSLVKKRAIWDTQATLEIFNLLYPRVCRVCPKLYNTERKLIYVCLDMELTGVCVDITRAEELRSEASIHVNQIKKELDKLVCPLKTVDKKGKETILEEFNPNSSKQMPLAFQKLGIPLKYKTEPKKNKKKGRKTGGGNWAFDEYSLIRYTAKPLAVILQQASKESWPFSQFNRTIHDIVRREGLPKSQLLPALVLKYRELSKLISTYYNHFIEDCVDTQVTPAGRRIGVLHCKFNQSEAATGRFSSSKPNLQNIPRLLGPRECFIPRKGRRFWLIDYAQVEMRFYAHFSKDEKMAGRLSLDLHRLTAADMYGKRAEDITKEERERAASVNFAVIYGSGAKTMGKTLSRRGSPTSTDKAKTFIERYHRVYPSVRRSTRMLTSQLQVRGYLENPFGRRYYLPKDAGYKGMNYLCQGTSADLIKEAMVEIWEYFKESNLKSKMLMVIHDEIVFEIPPSEAPCVLPRVVECMEDLERFFVPITVGLDLAKKRWSEKEKFTLPEKQN